LEQEDRGLAAVKGTRRAVEYYWTCGPAFLLYLLGQHLRIDTITYLDADLFFFGDPRPIYAELADGSVGVFEKRRPPVADPRLRAHFASFGSYNVGLVAFRRTADGLACLRWWRERCLEWCFDRIEPGRYGDQKYLDEWPARFGGVRALRHAGGGVAPWNLARHRFRRAGGRVWVDRDPLIFYHFVHFRTVTAWLYDTGLWRYRRRLPWTVRRHVYVPYARGLRAAGRMIRTAGGRVHPVDNLRDGRSRAASLARMLRQRSFLVVTDTFVL
jgi:hypothetical protein